MSAHEPATRPRRIALSVGTTAVLAALVTAFTVVIPAQSAGANPPDVPPTARQAMGMSWDGTHIVLFGGTENGGDIKGDTWIWNGSTWTQVFPANPPCPRHSHRMAYDSVRGEVVLFGGTGDATACTEGGGVRNDTWIWNGTTQTWT
jgi:hypothetical protein